MADNSTEKVLQTISQEIIKMTQNEFFPQVLQRYENQEKECFNDHKNDDIGFIKCMSLYQKKISKEERRTEFKINYLKNKIEECLQSQEEQKCQQFALEQIKQIQSDFLNKQIVS